LFAFFDIEFFLTSGRVLFTVPTASIVDRKKSKTSRISGYEVSNSHLKKGVSIRSVLMETSHRHSDAPCTLMLQRTTTATKDSVQKE
jgi:hypothetical protein